jgi:hypothetical protein
MSVHRGSNRFDDDDDERAKRGFDDNSFFDELRKKYPRVKITQKMKEDAVHMAQMHGGDWQDWLEEMVQKEQATIDNTKFNDDHLTTKNGYEHVATYKYTAPDGTVLFEGTALSAQAVAQGQEVHVPALVSPGLAQRPGLEHPWCDLSLA